MNTSHEYRGYVFSMFRPMMSISRSCRIALICLAGILHVGSARTAEVKQPPANLPFPRLMGMNIGAKNYDDPAYQSQLARLDVVILGFYKGWKPGYGMAKVVRNLKELSGGKILVGQYTILNECEGPVLK